jgi:hypothetical protein
MVLMGSPLLLHYLPYLQVVPANIAEASNGKFTTFGQLGMPQIMEATEIHADDCETSECIAVNSLQKRQLAKIDSRVDRYVAKTKTKTIPYFP